MDERYKKKPLRFSGRGLGLALRIVEKTESRESSRTDHFNLLRNLNDDALVSVPKKEDNLINTKTLKKKMTREEKLRKWKEEKLLKKTLGKLEKPPPFVVGKTSNLPGLNKYQSGCVSKMQESVLVTSRIQKNASLVKSGIPKLFKGPALREPIQKKAITPVKQREVCPSKPQQLAKPGFLRKPTAVPNKSTTKKEHQSTSTQLGLPKEMGSGVTVRKKDERKSFAPLDFLFSPDLPSLDLSVFVNFNKKEGLEIKISTPRKADSPVISKDNKNIVDSKSCLFYKTDMKENMKPARENELDKITGVKKEEKKALVKQKSEVKINNDEKKITNNILTEVDGNVIKIEDDKAIEKCIISSTKSKGELFSIQEELEASHNSISAFTPRRSPRLVTISTPKSSKHVPDDDASNDVAGSTFLEATNNKSAVRRSLRFIKHSELDDTPKSSKNKLCDLNLEDSLNAAEGSANLNENLKNLHLDSANYIDLNIPFSDSPISSRHNEKGKNPREKKISLLYTPETKSRYSFRKSVRGDLISFS